jgi:hypothetical protein|tara:strand:- start:15125 stop:15715 length:591 start_codon:yes stop_codon:yes gene_type:complete
MFKPITRELKLAHGSRRERRRVSRATESRLRPGRQGVQRIYRLTQEKEMIGEYEYLESIGVPRAQALQVMSRASTAFEREAVRRGQDPKAMKFGAEEMREVVEFLKASGVKEDAVGFLVIRNPAVLAYDVEKRLRPLFEYMEATFERTAEMFVDDVTKRPSLLGLDANENAKKMVDFLLSTGSTKEEAVEYLLRTL